MEHSSHPLSSTVQVYIDDMWLQMCECLLRSWMAYGLSVVRLLPDKLTVFRPVIVDVATLNIGIKRNGQGGVNYTVSDKQSSKQLKDVFVLVNTAPLLDGRVNSPMGALMDEMNRLNLVNMQHFVSPA